jgi:WD40 repeat protein
LVSEGAGRYDAFISYSHATDGALAPALQRGLTHLAKPWYRREAMSVFRDDTGLAVTPELWGSIETALDESSHLVLLASPDAAASVWVNREVEYWLATKGPETLLPVVTEGTLVWDDEHGVIDRDGSSAVPPALVHAFTEEPRYLDFSWAHDAGNLTLRDGRFRSAVAELAAPIRGVPKEELESEDLRQHRRALRLARAVVASLVLLTIAAVVAAALAITNANEAESRRVDSLSRELAARSLVIAPSRPDAALTVAVAANEVRGTTEARAALLSVLSTAQRLERVADVGARVAGIGIVDHLAFAPDGTIVLNTGTASGDHGVLLGVTPAGRVHELGGSEASEDPFLTFAGNRLLVAGISGVVTVAHGALESVTAGRPVVVAPDGTHAVVETDADTRLVDLPSGTVVWSIPAHVAGAEFSSDGLRAAVATSDGLVHVVDVTAAREIGPPINVAAGSRLMWTPRGGLVVVAPDANRVIVVSVDPTISAHDLPPANVAEGGVSAVSPDGTLLAFRGQSATTVWDLQTGTILWSRPDADDAAIAPDVSDAAVFSADSRHLLDLAAHGATLADASTGAVISHDPDAAFAYPDPTGHHAVTTGARTVLWDLVAGVRLSQREGFASAAWTADGAHLVTWGAETLLWDVRGDIADSEVLLSAGGIATMAFSADGAEVAAATKDGHVFAWRAAGDVAPAVTVRAPASTQVEVASGAGTVFEAADGIMTVRGAHGEVEHQFRVGATTDLKPFPDGRHVITQNDIEANPQGGAVTLWDARTGTALRSGTVCGADVAVRLEFSSDGRRMAYFENDDMVRICDSRGHTLRTLERPTGSKDAGSALALSSDGRQVAYGVKDRHQFAVRVVDTTTGATEVKLAVVGAPGWIVFSGSRIFAVGRDTVSGADLAGDGRFSFPGSGHPVFADHGRIAVFNESRGDAVTDGSLLRLYDVDGRRAIGAIEEPTLGIDVVVVPGDGASALLRGAPTRTITTPGTVVVRQAVTPAALLAEACRLAGGALSRADWARLVPGTDYMPTCARRP